MELLGGGRNHLLFREQLFYDIFIPWMLSPQRPLSLYSSSGYDHKGQHLLFWNYLNILYALFAAASPATKEFFIKIFYMDITGQLKIVVFSMYNTIL